MTTAVPTKRGPSKTTGAVTKATSDDEKAAIVIKTLAEARAFDAAAKESLAAAREHDALAKAAELQWEQTKHLTESARIESQAAEITLEQLRRQERFAVVSDLFHRTYHFTDYVSEKSVRQCLNTLTAWQRDKEGCDITIHLSTNGGSVIDGLALIDGILAIRRGGSKVTIVALGLCASMGTFILNAASEDCRFMGKYATLLLHEGSGVLSGTRGEMDDQAAMNEKLLARCWELMSERAVPTNSATTVKWLKSFVRRKDISLTSEESLKLGLIDAIL